MLNAIIRFSVRNKLIIGLCTLALIIWGIIDLKRLPIDALPDITSNQVQVITVSPSLAAPEVERLVTFPIEQANSNIPGIKEMRSISRFGLSVVTVVFNDETDIYWARQQVSERINEVRDQIPTIAGRPELAPATTGLGEIYQYILRTKKGYENKYDLAELRSIQDWIVRRQLLGTPGVADVSSFGGYLKQYEVAVVPSRLKSMNVTIAQVFSALEKNNQNSGGAYIEKGPSALFIRTEGLANTTDDIGKIVVRYTDSGIPVYIRDVAEVQIGHANRYGAMTYMNEGEVTGAVVLMLKGANSSQVIKGVKERIAQIRKTLPEGVILDAFYDRTKMVDNAIDTVKKNLVEGALIVIFVLVLFLGNFRAGLIVASVIPLSMLFAIIGMNVFGVSGNLMSLGALDFGLIVDGAVIIVEAVLHRLSHTRRFPPGLSITRGQLNEEVEEAAGKMMNSAVFGQIIILIVYLPILTLTGIEGKMFRPMAQTVSFALVGAFILSLTYVPMVTSLFLGRKIKAGASFSDKMVKWLQSIYKPVLQRAMQFPKMVIASVMILFTLAVMLLTRLGGEFIPELEEGDFAVDARILTGSSLTETIETTRKASTILQRFPEVLKIVTRIGASEIPTDPMPVEMTDIIISLKPKSEWVTAGSFDELADTMSRALQEIPGMTSGFQFPVQMRFNELISGARQDIVCKIFGENLDSLSNYAHKLGKLINSVKGATDLYIEVVTGLPQIVITYNRDAMAHYQLNIEEVNQVIKTAFAGETAGSIYENERRFDLVVRLQDEARKDLTDVQQLLIPTPSGLQVPLYQVAKVNITEGPNQIQREDAKRRIIVGFNVRGRDVKSVVDELSERAERQLTLPSGYFIKYGGQFENLVEARQRLSIAVPAALLLIFVLLYFAFGSLKYGVLIFTAIPLSAIGGIFALWLFGMPFSISAGVGFIALFGVSVLNGIVLIAEFNRLKTEGSRDIKHIIMKGTEIRLRPVLMTAAVASLGFLPMALSQGPGAEVQRPLATVVIGGLITATFLTLVVLPILYYWLERGGDKLKGSKRIVAVMAGLLMISSVQAQSPLTLEQALQKAIDQNLSLKANQAELGYWKELQSDVFDPSKTQVGVEYGNINSANNDNSFLIGQSFSLPVVYKSQRNLYQASGLAQGQYVRWKQAELVREVKVIFFRLVDGLERRKLLWRLDTIYSRFRFAADLRLKTGESNMLEKSSADIQWQQLQIQLQELEADIRILQQRLQWLLHEQEPITIVYQSPKKSVDAITVSDSTAVASHPQIAYGEMQERVAKAHTDIERARLSPEFTLGYRNLSIVGYQSTDGVTQKYYGGGDRFHVFNLSIGVPIFNKSTKARIRAGNIHQNVSRLNTQVVDMQLRQEWRVAVEEFKKMARQLEYYEQTGLAQSNRLLEHARLAYEKGEIGYPEWTLLMNSAVSIQLGYAETLRGYNEAAIKLDYLTEK